MKAEVEIYKGIEFVRLSVLTKEDSKAILQSSFRTRIIKILHGTEIISDCLPWSSYVEWFDQNVAASAVSAPKPASAPLSVKFKLAIE